MTVPGKTILHESILKLRGNSPLTIDKYLYAVDEFVKSAGPDPAKWNLIAVENFYNQLVDKMKVSTANSLIYALRKAFKVYSVTVGDPSKRFIPHIELQSADAYNKRKALSEKDAEALVRSALGRSPRDMRDRALLIIALETGMRRKSLAGMCWETIKEQGDFTIVHVPIKGRGGIQTFDVPLSRTALLGLQPWKKWCEWKGYGTGPVFKRIRDQQIGVPITLDKKALSTDAIYDIVIKRAAMTGQIEKMVPHEFRNTFITWRLQVGVPEASIAAVTGHMVTNPDKASEGRSRMIAGYARTAAAEKALLATPPWLEDLAEELAKTQG